MLICPKCKEQLVKEEHSWRCVHNHSFDIAKRGYVNLLLGNHKPSGDDKGMIVARSNFLTKGYYQPLCDTILECLSDFEWNVLVDAGCGEGFYTNQIAMKFVNCQLYGFDLSKAGIDHACKAHTQTVYGVANIFHLPIMDHSADCLLSIFAPYDIDEIVRVLKPNGYFIKVGPEKKHLLDLKTVVYEDVYENEVEQVEDKRMELVTRKEIAYEITLPFQQDIWALFQMTPYYWKTSKEGCARLKALEQFSTRVHFSIEIYKIIEM